MIKDLKEALAILEEETERRIQDIRQRTDSMCASLRAQGQTYINSIPQAVRELTLEQFCETYGGDVQYALEQLGLKKATGKKRLVHVEEKEETKTMKRSKTVSSAKEKEVKKKPPATTAAAAKSRKDFGPLFIHMERNNHPKISIRMDPEHTIDKLGKFSLDAPNDILTQLNDEQKSRLRDQVQDIQDKLDDFKKSLS